MPIEKYTRGLERLVSLGAEIKELTNGSDVGGGVGSGFSYARLVDGPLWIQEGGYLVFSDIGNDRRMKWAPGQGLSELQRPTNKAVGTTRDSHGRLVACEYATGRVTRQEPHDGITVIADSYQGKRLNHPNDVVIASDGSVYFTDLLDSLGGMNEGAVDFAGVYRGSPDLGAVTLLARDFVVPNGLAFSPDEKTLYISDTQKKHIRAFKLKADGTLDIASDRVFCELTGDRDGAPDGIKVDVEGNVYCGGPGGIWIIDPSGQHVGTIVHGASMTTNLAWGGLDWRTLFFTTWVAVGCVQMNIAGLSVPRRSRS